MFLTSALKAPPVATEQGAGWAPVCLDAWQKEKCLVPNGTRTTKILGREAYSSVTTPTEPHDADRRSGCCVTGVHPVAPLWIVVQSHVLLGAATKALTVS